MSSLLKTHALWLAAVQHMAQHRKQLATSLSVYINWLLMYAYASSVNGPYYNISMASRILCFFHIFFKIVNCFVLQHVQTQNTAVRRQMNCCGNTWQ
jgi:hypothetical protein